MDRPCGFFRGSDGSTRASGQESSNTRAVTSCYGGARQNTAECGGLIKRDGPSENVVKPEQGSVSLLIAGG